MEKSKLWKLTVESGKFLSTQKYLIENNIQIIDVNHKSYFLLIKANLTEVSNILSLDGVSEAKYDISNKED